MARYYSGSYGDQDALIVALDAALVAEGWTQDELDTVTNNRAAWHIGNLYVSASWNGTDLLLYQALGYTGGNAPGAHPNDSGSSHRVRDIGNAGGDYHFFTNDGTGVDFLHAVIEYSPGFYRHFSMGNLIKNGTWTGGEYLAGSEWDQGAGIDSPAGGGHSTLFDGAVNAGAQAATVHMEGFPNISASSKWGISHTGAAVGNDTAGVARYRALGGMRKGWFVQPIGRMDPTSSSEFIPGAPSEVVAIDPTYTTLEHRYWLGELPLLFVGSIAGFSVEDEVSIGAETWKCFPFARKAYVASSGIEQSGNAGIWYRKV